MTSEEHLRGLTPQQRAVEAYPFVDVGFLNDRLCMGLLGPRYMLRLEEVTRRRDGSISPTHPHVVTEAVLAECTRREALSLNEMLHDPRDGALVCSTEQLLRGGRAVYDEERASNQIRPAIKTDYQPLLEYSTKHIIASTERSDLASGCRHSFVAVVDRIQGKKIYLRPILMGAPSFSHERNDKVGVDLSWHGWDFYQVFPEDIDQLSRMQDVADDQGWEAVMKTLPEQRVKEAFAALLGDPVRADWGGELCDHYTCSAHLAGRPVTAAFLFKGPARFRPMTPAMLGKQGDQVYRLSQTPAQVLVIQHCHEIGEAVHAQLRAFAVRPHEARHYCLITGRQTYRILRAYRLLQT